MEDEGLHLPRDRICPCVEEEERRCVDDHGRQRQLQSQGDALLGSAGIHFSEVIRCLSLAGGRRVDEPGVSPAGLLLEGSVMSSDHGILPLRACLAHREDPKKEEAEEGQWGQTCSKRIGSRARTNW